MFASRVSLHGMSGHRSRSSRHYRASPLRRRVAALALLLCVAVAGLHVVTAQDVDNDGVLDGADACPGSTRGARDHVDAHGCEQDQIDVDRDGWCNPDRPRDANNKWLETRDEWCVGVDNCKFIPNADQARSLVNDTDGRGDACSTGKSQLRRMMLCLRAAHGAPVAAHGASVAVGE
jgi:hypothetical protein